MNKRILTIILTVVTFLGFFSSCENKEELEKANLSGVYIYDKMISSPLLQSKNVENTNDWKKYYYDIAIQLSNNRMELIKDEEVVEEFSHLEYIVTDEINDDLKLFLKDTSLKDTKAYKLISNGHLIDVLIHCNNSVYLAVTNHNGDKLSIQYMFLLKKVSPKPIEEILNRNLEDVQQIVQKKLIDEVVVDINLPLHETLTSINVTYREVNSIPNSDEKESFSVYFSNEVVNFYFINGLLYFEKENSTYKSVERIQFENNYPSEYKLPFDVEFSLHNLLRIKSNSEETRKQFIVTNNYGVYEDAYILMVEELPTKTLYQESFITINNYTFDYYDNSYIIVYKNKDIYTLKEAIDLNLLTMEDLDQIYEQYIFQKNIKENNYRILQEKIKQICNEEVLSLFSELTFSLQLGTYHSITHKTENKDDIQNYLAQLNKIAISDLIHDQSMYVGGGSQKITITTRNHEYHLYIDNGNRLKINGSSYRIKNLNLSMFCNNHTLVEDEIKEYQFNATLIPPGLIEIDLTKFSFLQDICSTGDLSFIKNIYAFDENNPFTIESFYEYLNLLTILQVTDVKIHTYPKYFPRNDYVWMVFVRKNDASTMHKYYWDVEVDKMIIEKENGISLEGNYIVDIIYAPSRYINNFQNESKV